jgi:transcriptional regulator with XRE-family HTH domain
MRLQYAGGMEHPTPLGRYLAKAKLTQIAFAARSGVPQCQISLYVTGKRKPGRRNAEAIDRATSGKVPVSAWDQPARRRVSDA